MPFALLFSVPLLAREWYVLTEETMLMGCFFLFVGAAMDFGGAAVGQYFDDQVQCSAVRYSTTGLSTATFGR